MNVAKLRGKMAEAGYSQAKLAKEIGLAQNTLNNKINGKTAFNTEEAIQLCRILHIDNDKDKIEIFFR